MQISIHKVDMHLLDLRQSSQAATASAKRRTQVGMICRTVVFVTLNQFTPDRFSTAIEMNVRTRHHRKQKHVDT